jgi:hypothetical protein
LEGANGDAKGGCGEPVDEVEEEWRIIREAAERPTLTSFDVRNSS